MALFKKKVKNDEDYYLASQWTLMGRKLRKHKLAIFSLWILGFLYTVALFGNFIAPSDLTAYNSKCTNSPPSKIHLFHEGKFVGPHIYGLDMERDPVTKRKSYVEDKEEMYKIKFFTHGVEYKWFGIFKSDIHLFGVDEGGTILLLGADSMGRDLFSRIILGSQISLTIPFAGTAISFILGILLGGISGYF
jgi:peptide/nickel transport system permease protein